jgi:hypothetical protein
MKDNSKQHQYTVLLVTLPISILCIIGAIAIKFWPAIKAGVMSVLGGF